MNETLAPPPSKVQNRMPTSMRFEHVQSILEADPALKGLLGPRNCPVDGCHQNKSHFSKATIEVAQFIHAEGVDAIQVPKNKILQLAAWTLNFNGDFGASAPVPPLAKTANSKPAHQEKPARVAKKNRARTVAKPETTPDPSAKPPAPEKAPLAESELLPEKQPLAVAVITARPAIALPDTLEAFTVQIKRRVETQYRQFVEDTIAIGGEFLAAVQKYGKNLKELAAMADLAHNTVAMYVKVAKRFGPSCKLWARAHLPPSADSLVRLARLEPRQLEDAVKKGKVTPDMGRMEVKAVLREYRLVNKKATVADTGATPGSSIVFDPNKRWKQFCADLDQEFDEWPEEHRKHFGDQLRAFAERNCS
jgi:hypothetical protein